MTREEAITKHRTFWHEIAKEVEQNFEQYADDKNEITLKKEVMLRLYPGDYGNIHNICYLCQYSLDMSPGLLNMCAYCPMNIKMPCLDGLYARFVRAFHEGRAEEAASFAKMIAEKEEVS